jgi:TonB-dependent receptor
VGQQALDVFDSIRGLSDERPVIFPLRTGVSLLAVCALLTAAPAYAQQSDADEPQAETEDNGDAIVVTGIRASLANAQNIKKNSDTVVDAITAEDIGALPDRSVTEALQRIPGVAINRFAGSNDPDHFSVEGSGVVIRGLNFVRSEFNGRDSFAAGVGGQALNFADVPSELLGSVIVSKNATADMIEGGLAGTVNLNTRKPFDNKGFHVGLNIEANYGDFRKKWTPTGSLLLSNTWETSIGTFGVLGNISYSRIKSRSDGLQISNFQTRDGSYVVKANAGGTQVCRNRLPSSTNTTTLPAPSNNCNAPSTAGADGFADLLPLAFAPLGGQFRTQEFDRTRDGQALAFQFESIDRKTVLTAQFLRSHTTNKWGERTFETGSDLSEYGTQPIGCLQNNRGPAELRTDGTFGDGTTRAECPTGAAFQNYTYDGDNLFQKGYITNPSDGWRGAPNAFIPIGGLQQVAQRREVDEESTNTDYALNLKTSLTDRLHINLDADYTKSVKNNLDVSIMGSTWADQELDLTGELPVITPHKPNYLNYSWDGAPKTELIAATDAQYFADKRVQFWRSAMDHIEQSTGSEFQFRGDLAYDFDETSFLRQLKFGARFADRDQTVRYTTYNWGVLSEVWAGSSPVSVSQVGSSNVDFYAFPDFFRGQTPGPAGAYYYNGNLIGDYAGASSFAKSVNAAWVAKGGNAGWVPLAERNGVIAGTPFLPSDVQPISQQDTAVYLQAKFGSEDFGGMRLSGNLGVRYVASDIRSDGQISVGTRQQLGISQPYSVRCAPVPGPGGVGTVPAGGLCSTLNAAQYAALQTFADGSNVFDSAKNNYDYFLPSFNANLGVSDDVNFRFAVSKVLTRPDNAYLRNFLTTGLDGAGNLTAQTGNPFLKPATAWQFDLTAEWYFARVGSLTFDAFYKDINNFFYQAITDRSITNNGVTQNILVRGPANFDGKGKVKGFEVAYQQTYDFLPGFLDGLGVSANYTYIKSKGLPNTFLNGGGLANVSTVLPGNLPLEQLSKHNVNATVFYEKGPVSLRAAYNWRSRFLLTASDVIFPYYSIYNEATGQLDASAFISLSQNIKIGVQGVNLLNEVTKTSQSYTGDPGKLAPRSYFMNDRRFSFIVRANF